MNTKINELKLINIKLPSSIQTLVDLTEKNKLIELKKENEEYKNDIEEFKKMNEGLKIWMKN